MTELYTARRSQLPPSYVAFIEGHGGWEGDLGDELGYVVLWDCATVHERYHSYDMAMSLDARWFPFGSDGGGEMLCFDLSSGSDKVFWIPFIGMSGDVALPQDCAFADIARAVLGTA